MKKIIPIFLLITFMLPINFGMKNVKADNDKKIILTHNELVFMYDEQDLGSGRNFLQFSNEELLYRLSSMGFSVEQVLNYVYPKLAEVVTEICHVINKTPIDSTVDTSNGWAVITPHQAGEVVDVTMLYRDLFYALLSGASSVQVKIKVEIVSPVLKEEDNADLTYEKASFTTYINGNNQEGRIHNIKQALSKFNGRAIAPSEKISFNEIIGDTTAENGYKKAKVILNGKYVDDFGGGVCQAATTLYNSALLAGLTIKQVRPHSLKVGYVKGSFDAMVSSGISDLIIENPYDRPIFLHTYATDTECGVKIFGTKNDFLIERRSERFELDEEESKNYSYKSEGYLDYYKDGELVKTEKIRSDKYYKVKLEDTAEISESSSRLNESAL